MKKLLTYAFVFTLFFAVRLNCENDIQSSESPKYDLTRDLQGEKMYMAAYIFARELNVINKQLDGVVVYRATIIESKLVIDRFDHLPP